MNDLAVPPTDTTPSAESKQTNTDELPVSPVARRIQDALARCGATSLVCVQLDPLRDRANRWVELAEELSTLRDETVLLVDGDIRRRQLTAELGLQGEAGLAEYLSIGRPATSVVRPRVRPRLDLLPSGRGWLGDSKRLPASIAELLHRIGRHRLVLVMAGPPEDPVAKAFQQCCHATLLIMSSGVTERSRAEGALHESVRAGARIAGALVA